jgi:hypothetical protein
MDRADDLRHRLGDPEARARLMQRQAAAVAVPLETVAQVMSVLPHLLLAFEVADDESQERADWRAQVLQEAEEGLVTLAGLSDAHCAPAPPREPQWTAFDDSPMPIKTETAKALRAVLPDLIQTYVTSGEAGGAEAQKRAVWIDVATRVQAEIDSAFAAHWDAHGLPQSGGST